VIYPSVWLEGGCRIGRDCQIGPAVRMRQAVVGDRTTLQYAYLHECRIGSDVNLGPFVHIRPGTVIGDRARIGNFIEIKNSQVGEGSKTPHLSYIGDTDIGREVNVGCGVVTVNYDGKNKYRTRIDDGAFVGCNANLVAPVTVGSQAYVAAGSTVTKDVPPLALAVARAQQKNIEGWVERRNKK
ncbi:MAG: bifunctional UDP-N-acetylglucosamine diphosphorylase/glucosamine-1-phosphate N-acetyltransferase GlmU, partial [Negativicutes bacterium]|nr:bifunctional UDP-N-acetylglucosamine diphosphorylase/glucosamine-1-phosphate N-acetyltransferase GlmU [Negativicutes bacterium]